MAAQKKRMKLVTDKVVGIGASRGGAVWLVHERRETGERHDRVETYPGQPINLSTHLHYPEFKGPSWDAIKAFAHLYNEIEYHLHVLEELAKKGQSKRR